VKQQNVTPAQDTAEITYWRWDSQDYWDELNRSIEDLVDNRINARIGRQSITVLDIDTHRPITSAEVKFIIQPGIDIALLNDVLMQDGIDIGIKYLSQYAKPNQQSGTTNNEGAVSFFADDRASVQFEITHNGYHFVQDRISEVGRHTNLSERKSLFIPENHIAVLMSETGSKVRVKILQ